MRTVCVLVVSNKYGDNVFVCAGPDVAYRQLEKYVDEQWDRNMVTEKPEDPDERIEWYFETMGNWENSEFFPGERVIGHASMYDAILGVIDDLQNQTEAAEYTDTGLVWDSLARIKEMAQEGLGEV